MSSDKVSPMSNIPTARPLPPFKILARPAPKAETVMEIQIEGPPKILRAGLGGIMTALMAGGHLSPTDIANCFEIACKKFDQMAVAQVPEEPS